MIKSILKISLTVYFLLGLHYVGETVGGTGLYLPNNIIGWAFIATFIGVGFWHLSRSGIIYYSTFSLFCIVALLLISVPMYYNNNLFAERAIYRLMFIAGGVLFYFIMLQFDFNEKDRKNLMFIILAATVIQSIIGVIQYYELGSQQYMIFYKEEFPYGSFRQKNVMTTFMATGIGISLYLLNYYQDCPLTKIKNYFLYVIPYTGSLIIAAIPSKAGYVGLLSAIIFQIFSTKFRARAIQIWFVILLLGILTGWATPHITKAMTKHNVAQDEKVVNYPKRDIKEQMSTINTRLGIWSTTWTMIKDNPLTGVGYGYWERKWREYAVERRQNDPDWDYRLRELLDHPHNEILLWVSEGGIIPAIAFLVLIAGYFFLIGKFPLLSILSHIALISPIILHTIFEFPFRLSVAHWIVVWLLIFIYDKPKLGYQLKSKLVMVLPAIIIPVGTYYNMTTTYKNLQLLVEFSDSPKNNYLLLQEIKHPGPLYRKYEFELLRSMMDMAIKTDDKELMQSFLDRADEFLEHTPHISIYQALYNANNHIGKNLVAEGWRLKAKYWFPDPFEETGWLYNKDDKKKLEEDKRKLAERLKETELFLLDNKNNNSDIIKTSTGLQYRVIEEGEGKVPKRKNKVRVNYAGPFYNLEDYNLSKKDGKDAEFKIGELIEGWQEGMLLMKEGAEFEFFIHPKLGYGRQGRRGVPGNAYLIFNVKLIQILE